MFFQKNRQSHDNGFSWGLTILIFGKVSSSIFGIILSSMLAYPFNN